MTTAHDPKALAALLDTLDLTERLRLLAEQFPGRVAFSTSLGQEDQVITDAIWRADLPIRVFTLDTGRLFEETYALIDETCAKYGKSMEVFFPDTAEVEALTSTKGLPPSGRYRLPVTCACTPTLATISSWSGRT